MVARASLQINVEGLVGPEGQHSSKVDQMVLDEAAKAPSGNSKYVRVHCASQYTLRATGGTIVPSTQGQSRTVETFVTFTNSKSQGLGFPTVQTIKWEIQGRLITSDGSVPQISFNQIDAQLEASSVCTGVLKVTMTVGYDMHQVVFSGSLQAPNVPTVPVNLGDQLVAVTEDETRVGVPPVVVEGLINGKVVASLSLTPPSATMLTPAQIPPGSTIQSDGTVVNANGTVIGKVGTSNGYTNSADTASGGGGTGGAGGVVIEPDERRRAALSSAGGSEAKAVGSFRVYPSGSGSPSVSNATVKGSDLPNAPVAMQEVVAFNGTAIASLRYPPASGATFTLISPAVDKYGTVFGGDAVCGSNVAVAEWNSSYSYMLRGNKQLAPTEVALVYSGATRPGYAVFLANYTTTFDVYDVEFTRTGSAPISFADAYIIVNGGPGKMGSYLYQAPGIRKVK